VQVTRNVNAQMTFMFSAKYWFFGGKIYYILKKVEEKLEQRCSFNVKYVFPANIPHFHEINIWKKNVTKDLRNKVVNENWKLIYIVKLRMEIVMRWPKVVHVNPNFGNTWGIC
jgi:hypothetical protein